MISKPLVKYVMMAALRDKLIGTMVLLILLGSSISMFLGSAAVTEELQFTAVLTGGGLRFLGVIGLVLFVSFHIRRTFDHKEVEFLLSRPVTRLGFLLSHAFAFTLLAVIVGLAITPAVALIGRPPLDGLLLWGASILVELVIMVNTALFFSMVLGSAAGSALACLGLYVLGRMIGVILGISHAGAESMIMDLLGKAMNIIAIIIPRLDLLGQTTWLVHGTDAAGISYTRAAGESARWFIETIGIGGFIFFQVAFFSALLLSAAIYDFTRRQF